MNYYSGKIIFLYFTLVKIMNGSGGMELKIVSNNSETKKKITFLREVHVDELRNGLQINISSRIGWRNKRALGEIVDLACKYIQNNLLFKCKVHLFGEKHAKWCENTIHVYLFKILQILSYCWKEENMRNNRILRFSD